MSQVLFECNAVISSTIAWRLLGLFIASTLDLGIDTETKETWEVYILII
jgi:hypothetical protein